MTPSSLTVKCLISLLCASVLAAACGDGEKAETMRKEIKEAGKATKDYLSDVASKLKNEVSTWDEDIATWKDKAAERAAAAGARAKDRFDSLTGDLDKRRREIAQDMEHLKSLSGDKLQAAKELIEKKIAQLKKALQEAKEQFK